MLLHHITGKISSIAFFFFMVQWILHYQGLKKNSTIGGVLMQAAASI
jgi:hypothetical protein